MNVGDVEMEMPERRPVVQGDANPPARIPQPAPASEAAQPQPDRDTFMEVAAAARLRATVREGVERMGEDLIRSDAGDASAYPALSECPSLAPSGRAAHAALERHVQSFLIEDRDRRRPEMSARDQRRYHAAIDRGIKKWRKHIHRHRDRIGEDVVAEIWPHYRDEAILRHQEARHRAEQRSKPRSQKRIQDLVRDHGWDRTGNDEQEQGRGHGPRHPSRGRDRD